MVGEAEKKQWMVGLLFQNCQNEEAYRIYGMWDGFFSFLVRSWEELSIRNTFGFRILKFWMCEDEEEWEPAGIGQSV